MKKQIKWNFVTDEEMFSYLFMLQTKFDGIDPNEYYLSYSGGRDSHFLFWFIKEYLKDDKIKIVACNTRFEFLEIYKRMRRNADVIVMSEITPKESKEKHGIPCFGKQNDEWIDRYQKAKLQGKEPTAYNMKIIMGEDMLFNTKDGIPKKSQFALPKKAREWTLSGDLHRVSKQCCDDLKEKPLIKWGKENKRKAIICVRTSESKLRAAQYNYSDQEDGEEVGCFKKNLDFIPIWDLKEDMLEKIEEYYDIEIPNIYNYVSQTGCAGCPEGCNSRRCNTKDELKMVTPQKRKWIINHFYESYKVLGISTNEEDYR
jgi:3'-phosphoadenosine 5'-phosphosulfate sulfotransferase (PAPS reductase)/FAD synthetase